MSFINNILGKLKKGGAKAPPADPVPPGEPAPSGETPIQVAHPPKSRIKFAMIGLVVLGLAGLAGAGWYWWSSKQKIVAPVKVAQAPIKPILAPQVAPPPPVEVPNVASGVVTPQPVAASQPISAVSQEAASKEVVPKEIAPKEAAPKESEHGTEAGTLSPGPEMEAPPPAKIRNKPPYTASRPKHKKMASMPESNTKSAEREDESSTTSAAEGRVDKKVKPLSLEQQADNEFRRANGLVQQGRIDEALVGYESALQLDSDHDAARQALVALLLQNNRNADAESVLQDGLKHNIKHSDFAMLLARIQVERDASWSALLTLQKTLPYAERQADYQAFMAALLQRLNRHKEAVTHYQAAVQLSPNSGVWWMGLGISQQALQRNDEARNAFKRALDTHTLNADLQAYVSQQLKRL